MHMSQEQNDHTVALPDLAPDRSDSTIAVPELLPAQKDLPYSIVTDSQDDRRIGSRFPRAVGLGLAQLRVGRKTLVVEVLDESAGGYMVAAMRIPKKASSTARVDLITTAGLHPTRVIWRRNVDGRVRLGLQRLPENMGPRSDTSWFGFMLFAVAFGLALGYLAASQNQEALVKRVIEASRRGGEITNPHVSPIGDEFIGESQ